MHREATFDTSTSIVCPAIKTVSVYYVVMVGSKLYSLIDIESLCFEDSKSSLSNPCIFVKCSGTCVENCAYNVYGQVRHFVNLSIDYLGL
jgi:hypothetical protein